MICVFTLYDKGSTQSKATLKRVQQYIKTLLDKKLFLKLFTELFTNCHKLYSGIQKDQLIWVS